MNTYKTQWQNLDDIRLLLSVIKDEVAMSGNGGCWLTKPYTGGKQIGTKINVYISSNKWSIWKNYGAYIYYELDDVSTDKLAKWLAKHRSVRQISMDRIHMGRRYDKIRKIEAIINTL